METNENLRKQILEIVDNQIKDNNPPETNLTLKRLVNSGYNASESKQFIAQCVSVEIFNVIKYGESFDKKRYLKNLKQLPKEPFTR